MRTALRVKTLVKRLNVKHWSERSLRAQSLGQSLIDLDHCQQPLDSERASSTLWRDVIRMMFLIRLSVTAEGEDGGRAGSDESFFCNRHRLEGIFAIFSFVLLFFAIDQVAKMHPAGSFAPSPPPE